MEEKNPQIPDTQPQENLLDDVHDVLSMEGYDKPTRVGRIVLFVIAAFQLLTLALIPSLPDESYWILIGVAVGLSLIFAGLGIWSYWKPYYAILIGLIIYGGLALLDMISSGFFGIFYIIKVIIVVLLIYPIKNARDVQHWKDSQRKKRQGL